ncbi:MAG: hypothetical protein IKO94_10760 [Selenomonadaceae bacterium]|nr:hypothetical protein [Selenomonadaceae bacterium]
MKKKIMMAGLFGALLAGQMCLQLPAEAAKTEASQSAATQQASKENDVYMYTSKAYGYTIPCPIRPNVIPASLLYEGQEGVKGEALIFDNDEYNIKLAWVIFVNAFDDKDVPDYNKMSEKEAADYLEKMRKSNPYEDVGFVDLGPKNKAFFAVTAKEVEIDTDGDGKPDTVATTDTQTMEVFFRGDKGGHYRVQLLNNPQLRPEAMRDCRYAVSNFPEGTAGDQGKQKKK